MNSFLRLTIICCIFLSALSSFSQDPCGEIKNKKLQKTWEEALLYIDYANASKTEAQKTMNFREANMRLKEVLDADPEYAGVYFFLGYVNIFKPENNLVAAEKYLLQCVELCPDGYPDAYYYLGKLYYGKEDFANTILYLNKYLSNPDNIKEDSALVDAQDIVKWAEAPAQLVKKPVPFEPRLVKGISSDKDEYLVIISPDNEMALYTRKTEVASSNTAWVSESPYKEKFYYSIRKNGVFDNGMEMPAPFNRMDNEGGATLTIDNKELFYTVCVWGSDSAAKRYYNCDIYTSRLGPYGWEDITQVETINLPDSWESQPSISSDGKSLYFISDRKGGMGGYDIYRSVRDANGRWGEPQNLGKKINTVGNEKSPFIHTDSQTLYYSSSGRPGMGGYDIFYSRIQDDGSWATSVNIGFPINSKFDDVGFFVSTDGHYGYFASNNQASSMGGWDFYAFELYEEARPEKVLFIKGEIKDEANNAPIPARVEIRNIETRAVTEIPVDSVTGTYVAVMLFNSDYVITVKKDDYVYESRYIAQEDTTFNEPSVVDMEIQAVEVGKSYRMSDIYYESNSADLTVNSKKVIDEFAIFLNENPGIQVAIHGHTDNLGSDESNLALSQDRSKSVYEYLVSIGISASRLSYQGFGESKPVADNSTPEGRALNRRTEFVITGK